MTAAGGSSPAILVVVQARTGSSRLPGKVLMDLAGRPMLGFQLARLARLDHALDAHGLGPAQLVVATSDRPGDDAIETLAGDLGVEVVRGSEDDVLGRFALALDRHPAEVIVRLTGDCPLTDPSIVADAVHLHVTRSADYTSNVLPRSFPKGLDVEVLSEAAFRSIAADAPEGPDREHVTPFAYRHPHRFRLANLHAGRDLGEEWWTVDTAEDIERLRAMVRQVEDPVSAGWLDVLAAVGMSADPAPGAVHLRPLPTSGPTDDGTGWTRRWEALADARPIGTVAVTRAVVEGEGRTVVDLDVEPEHRAGTEAALAQLLTGDQQTR